MRIPFSFVAAAVLGVSGLLAGTLAASATVQVAIDLTHQRYARRRERGAASSGRSRAPRSGFSTAGGKFRADASRADALFQEISHVADAPRDLLSRRLRDPRHLFDRIARPARLARLRTPVTRQCSNTLRHGEAGGRADLDQRDAAGARCPSLSPTAIALTTSRQSPTTRQATRFTTGDDRPRLVRRAARRERTTYEYYAYGSQGQPQYYGYQPGYSYAPAYLGAPQRVGVTRYQPLLPGF